MTDSNTSLCHLLYEACKESGIKPDNSEYQSGETQSEPQANNTSGSITRRRWSNFDRTAMERLTISALEPFRFSKTEMLIIASLFQRHLSSDRPISLVRLLRTVVRKNADSLAYEEFVTNLALDGIVTLTKPLAMRYPISLDMLHSYHKYEKGSMHEYEVSLSKAFIDFLIDEQRPVLHDTGFSSNQDFLLCAFQCNRMASRYFGVSQEQWRVDLFVVRATERLKNLYMRLERTTIEIPFRDLSQEHNLGYTEQLALLFLVEQESHRASPHTSHLSRIVDPDMFSRDASESVLSPQGTLQKQGLIQVQTTQTPIGSKTVIGVEHGAFRYITSNSGTYLESSTRDICKGTPSIIISQPSKAMEDLILPDNKIRLLESVIQSCKSDNQQRLKDWGFGQPTDDDSNKENSLQILILFHGRPGVGKTLAAEAVADALGKEMMSVDISQIQDKWVGESEKNLRSIFTSYQQCQRKSSNPPVLFLNECDQLLSNRIEHISQSSDQMRNAMQNMLLEFLENFSGICIATTNLVSNLDPAFSRRFTHKIELPWPDLPSRIKLWDTLVPKALPIEADINFEKLARIYSFSGSQIKTVIYNAAQDAANRESQFRIVLQSDLIKFAELEQSGSFDKSNKATIGYN